jgi:peptidyl-tRNA hydrolase, PTH1 family
MGRLSRMFSRFRSARADGDGAVQEPAQHSEARWAIAGLGNPGEQYRNSRHNTGFMVIERLADACGVRLERRKFKGLIAEARVGGQSAILVKPHTYYNLSGDCVAAILGYYKVPAEHLIVVHDELDLEPGQLRLKRGGSDAGNRGVRSIADALATPEFVRVRVGIGRPEPGQDARERVLDTLNRSELEAFSASIARAANAVEAVVATGLERAMGVYNQRS